MCGVTEWLEVLRCGGFTQRKTVRLSAKYGAVLDAYMDRNIFHRQLMISYLFSHFIYFNHFQEKRFWVYSTVNSWVTSKRNYKKWFKDNTLQANCRVNHVHLINWRWREEGIYEFARGQTFSESLVTSDRRVCQCHACTHAGTYVRTHACMPVWMETVYGEINK